MIEVDNFWHQKTFDTVFADLQRSHDREIHEQENTMLHCTENEKTHEESDEKEIFDHCSESQIQPVNSAREKKSRK